MAAAKGCMVLKLSNQETGEEGGPPRLLLASDYYCCCCRWCLRCCKHNSATATLFRKYAVEQATRSHQLTKAPLAMTKAATRLRRKTWTTSSHKKKKKGRSIRPKTTTTTTKKKKKRFRFGFESGLSLILCSSPSQRCCYYRG